MAFVLVHGAWTGAFVWDRVAPLLIESGSEVHTPTLRGLGHRADVPTSAIDLHMHVEDVLEPILENDLHATTLVGHSYGGVVIAMVADQVPNRIAHLVFLDALVPFAGESVNDLRRAKQGEPADTSVSDEVIWPPQVEGMASDRRAQALALGRLSPQPRRTFAQPVSLDAPLEDRAFTRTYVRARGRIASAAYARGAAIAESSPAWSLRELDGGHDLMLTNPRGVARLLSEIADTSSVS